MHPAFRPTGESQPQAEDGPPQGPSTQAPSFEEAFTRLEETVRALESGGLTLEAATGLYEEGMRLVQLCNRLLSAAELKISQLKTSYPDLPSPEEE
jgi:exodeoxyribonuclease VII small subunit